MATGEWIGKNTESGELEDVDISSKISHRLTLVTTETTPLQSKQMEKTLLEDDNIDVAKEDILSSNTYNIKLTLCKKQIVRTGQGVRVSVGFPKGFNYDSSLNGVTFKAYHYITDDNTGQITGVEEIPITVTPYGLIITVQSFSPFTIAAVDSHGEIPQNAEKTVILSHDEGGTITADDSSIGLLTLHEGESKTVTVKASEGYVIDSVNVAGEYKDVESISRDMKIDLNYADVQNGSIVDARFISEKVAEKEKAANETVVLPVAEPAKITLKNKVTVTEGSELVISPEISAGEHTYQWYHGEEQLTNQVDKNLVIDNVKQSDAGEYTLKVTTFTGAASAVASAKCTVNVTEKNHEHVAGNPVKEDEILPSCVKAGSHEEVVYCTICEAELSRSTVEDAAEGHSFGEWEDIKHANCRDTGIKQRVCNVCEYSESEITAVTDEHTFGAWKLSDDGKTESRTCTLCGKQETRDAEVQATEEPKATDAPEATEEPKATDAPKVTEEPKATDAPEVTEEPKATEEPGATEEPKATGEPQSTETPSGKETPSDNNTGNSQNTVPGTSEVQPAGQTSAHQEGDMVPVEGVTYMVTGAALQSETVEFSGVDTSKKKVVIPDEVLIDGVSYKVTSIADGAFKGDKKLQTVNIGSNVTSIGNKAFYKCNKLTKVTIPASVKKIGKKAFYGCSTVKNIKIKSAKITKKGIGSKAFYGINDKAKIKVPKKKTAVYKKLLKKAGVSSGVVIK